MKKRSDFSKKHWAGLSIVGLIIFVIIGGWTLLKVHEEPQPQGLGPQLTYVGKRDFGCQVPRLTIYCDGEPSTVYYFATDMTEDEMAHYFKTNKEIGPTKSNGGFGADYSFDYYSYDSPAGEFVISRYSNTNIVSGLGQTSKKFIVGIDKEDYSIAQKALE